MQRYGVSDGTVKRAVGQLRSEGLVKTDPAGVCT
jgi:DNA-binding GntR family transcriptional regulator